MAPAPPVPDARGHGEDGFPCSSIRFPTFCRSPPPPLPTNFWTGGSPVVKAIVLVLVLGFVYLAYFWMIRRVHVPSGHVLVLVKKDGTKSLEADQIIIPGPPDPTQEPKAYAAWLD